MELLEDPEIKAKYDKCKLTVKIWEHQFIKKHKRIPSKLDIREAPIEVRHSYRKYFQLKTAALEQSFMDIEGFETEQETTSQSVESEDSLQGFIYSTSQNITDNSSGQEDNDELVRKLHEIHENKNETPQAEVCKKKSDVWGAHLNNHQNSIYNKEKLQNTSIGSITNKLFSGSKFNKRNPRKSLNKSLTFSQKSRSDNAIDSPEFFSQPSSVNKNYSFSQENTTEPTISMSAEVAALTHKSFTHSVPINPISNLDSKFNNSTLRNIDKGWLQRVAQHTGVALNLKPDCDSNIIKTKIDYSSDSDIIESSDDETSRTPPNLHIAKKLKLSCSLISKTPSFGNENLRQAIKEPNDSAVHKYEISVNKLDNTVSDTFRDIKICTTTNKNDTQNLEPQASLRKPLNNRVEESKIIENLEENADLEKTVDNVVRELEPLDFNLHKPLEDIVINNGLISKTPAKKQVKVLNKTPKTNPSKKCGKKPKAKDEFSAPKTAKKSKTSKENSENDHTISPRRSTRNNKVKISFEELNSSDEDPFHSDNDERDPEFTVDKNPEGDKSVEIESLEIQRPSAKKKKSKKLQEKSTEKEKKLGEVVDSSLKVQKTPKKVQEKSAGKGRRVGGVNFDLRANVIHKKKGESQEIVEEDFSSQKYELEYSVKPRIVAARHSSIVKVLTETALAKKGTKVDKKQIAPDVNDKKSLALEKLEKKISAGQLNENFVTVDLRKKVFVKGKSNFKFSKYKKSQWKAKKKALYGPDMDMSGCDGGKLTCFNCGQDGHFAARCPNNKGDQLLPMMEEESEFMSLEEAQEMALSSNLSVRKPNMVTKNGINNENGDENETENNHTSENSGKEEDEEAFNDDADQILLAEAIKLEEYVKKLDINGYVDNLKIVAPYFPEDSQLFETPPEVYQALHQFGHTSFRGGQEKAIMRILQGKSTLVTLATGTGKSLCYQLPAYLYAQRGDPSIALIISPLVSLMEDQVIGIPKFLKAACLHTNQTPNNRQKIIEALEAHQLNVLLVSPEAIVAGEKQTGFRSLFRKLPPIAFACIDEVHCISQWSHNFRPSYLMVSRVLRESLGVKTILGLTATATRATCDNIIELLGIPDGIDGIIKDTPLPDNLHLTASKDAHRDNALLNLLMSEKFKTLKSIIVYCTRRDECERIAAFLRTSFKEEVFEGNGGPKNKRKRHSVQAEPYHAGLSGSRRRTIQNSFMSGDLRIVVATVAFGMGINKSDIRAVIHFNMPNSFESYVQEVGRAGRDGLPAYCHVFLNSQGRDESELRRHIHANSIDRHVIRKLLQKVFVPCSCQGRCPKHEVAFSIEETVQYLDIPEENITTLLCYLELHKNKYIELLSPAYTICKVISYGGLNHIKKAAKECPPLAMALAMYHSKEEKDNILQFPIVDVASTIGWESGICKHKLKNLEWTTENNIPKRSFLSVRFSNLGFRFLAPGNLPEDQLDEALDNLYTIVVNQEHKALKQLTAVYKTLTNAAEKSYKECVSLEKIENKELKLKIREYFGLEDPLADVQLESLREMNEDQLVNDIRAVVCMYRDNQFTGRAIARIFHGIQSPNYPAVIWGKCRFWRSHLHEDFHAICKIASREIIKMN